VAGDDHAGVAERAAVALGGEPVDDGDGVTALLAVVSGAEADDAAADDERVSGGQGKRGKGKEKEKGRKKDGYVLITMQTKIGRIGAEDQTRWL
jgi:hypothetical protein